MPRKTLATARADLMTLDADDLDAWLAGDAERLSARTGAAFPSPPAAPPLFDEDMPTLREMLSRDPDSHRHSVWLIVERQSRRPLGIAGFNAGMPPGATTAGYAIYPGEQGKGFATEALRALVAWIFSRGEAEVVQATIPPWNAASIRVAEKVGMRQVSTSEDVELGKVLVYQVERAAPPIGE